MGRQLAKVHARGDARRLDAVLELVSWSVQPRPLTRALDELPARIAEVLEADVCSIYLLEGEALVMRGNVGFSPDALGEVRLRVGEGVTGRAVECLRPISLGSAPAHAGWRPFPELDEARYPVFLAVPVPGPEGPLGALVAQRRRLPAFDAVEVELAAALTAPIAAAVLHADYARKVGGARRADDPRGAHVTLAGRSITAGRAIGPIAPFLRPALRQRHAALAAPNADPKPLDRALGKVRRTLDQLLATPTGIPEASRDALEGIGVMVEDARLRERALELCGDGLGLSQALGRVGAEAVRRAVGGGDAFTLDRAHELAELCETLSLLCAEDVAWELPRSAILAGDQFSLFDLMIALRAKPAGLLLSARSQSPKARALAALVGVPALTEVVGLFRWVAQGDLALLDGDHGIVRLNPTPAEVALVRLEKRKG